VAHAFQEGGESLLGAIDQEELTLMRATAECLDQDHFKGEPAFSEGIESARTKYAQADYVGVGQEIARAANALCQESVA
jgi:hypothetical protein